MPRTTTKKGKGRWAFGQKGKNRVSLYFAARSGALTASSDPVAVRGPPVDPGVVHAERAITSTDMLRDRAFIMAVSTHCLNSSMVARTSTEGVRALSTS